MSTATSTLKLFSEPPVSPARLSRPYYVYVYSEPDGFQPGGPFGVIELRAGLLFVDGRRVANPRFGPRTVSWSEHLPEGGHMSGRLSFSLSGVECSGTITIGGVTGDLAAVRYDVFATAVPSCAYNTQITTARHPADTQESSVGADGWTDGLQLVIGYQQQPGQPLPTAQASLGGQDVSDYIGLSITGDDALKITLTLFTAADALCTFDNGLYLSGSLVFSTFGDSFSGQITGTCQDRTGQSAYVWKGSVAHQSDLAPLHSAHARQATGTGADVAAGGAGVAADGAGAGPPLSVGELMTLVPDEAVSQLTNEMLVENMKWAIAQSSSESPWLGEFFGEQPPVLQPSQKAIARQGLDWYQKDFAIAYLTSALNGLQGEGAPSVKLDAQQQAKLDHYLKHGLGLDNTYNAQMGQLHSAAYLETVRRLQDYIADGGEKWAALLYDALTSSGQLALLLNRVNAEHDMSSMNEFAALLTALDPSGNYAKRYAQAVIARVLLGATTRTKVTDKELTMTWLPDALEAFSKEYTGAGGEGQSLAQAVSDAAAQFGGFTGLASQFADFLIAASGADIHAQSGAAREAFAARFPNLTRAADVLFFISWVGGVFNVVASFVNWNAESPTQRASVITSCVDLVARAADRVINLLKGRLTLDDWNELNRWASSNVALEDFSEINRAAVGGEDDDWAQIGLEESADLFDAETKTIVTAGTRWAQIYENASKVVAVVGIATSAVFTVLSTIDFINDIKTGQPVSQQTLDGILMVSNAITTVCLVLDLALGLAVFALAAAVFAIIGLVVSIILLFMPKPKQEPPSTKFMTDTGIPFVNNLPPPPPALADAGPRPRLVYNLAGA
jgi:hypothetical protein